MTKQKTNRKTPAAKPKPERKKDKFLGLLRQKSGASIAELVEALGWLPHTARAMLTGLRKQGYVIDKTKAKGGTRYSITAEPAK